MQDHGASAKRSLVCVCVRGRCGIFFSFLLIFFFFPSVLLMRLIVCDGSLLKLLGLSRNGEDVWTVLGQF